MCDLSKINNPKPPTSNDITIMSVRQSNVSEKLDGLLEPRHTTPRHITGESGWFCACDTTLKSSTDPHTLWDVKKFSCSETVVEKRKRVSLLLGRCTLSLINVLVPEKQQQKKTTGAIKVRKKKEKEIFWEYVVRWKSAKLSRHILPRDCTYADIKSRGFEELFHAHRGLLLRRGKQEEKLQHNKLI